MKQTRIAFPLCYTIAAVGIAASTWMLTSGASAAGSQAVRIVTFFLFGVGPIVAYFLVVRQALTENRHAVPESSIDAVYYLGFLITLTTLLSTVISYGALGKTDASSVNVVFIGASFALSLVATAVALFGRIVLIQQRDAAPAAPDAEAFLEDRLIELDDSYAHLSSVMRDASSRFEQGLASANVVAAEEMSRTVREAQSRLVEFVNSAAEELRQSQAAAHEASAAAAKSMSEHQEALFARIASVIDEMRESLKQFVKAASLEAPASALAEGVNDVTRSLAEGRQQLSELFKLLETLQSHASASVSTIDALQANVRRSSESAAAMSDAFGKATSGAAALDVTPLHAGLAQLDASVQRMVAATARAEQQYATASSEAAAQLASRTKELTAATALLSEAFVSMAGELAQSAGALSQRIA